MNQKKAGVLLSYGQTILSTLISLTYTPVMLRLLGQSEYGLYTLVNGFVSNLSLLSFGMGSAYMRYYSRAEAQDGEDGVARINGMFMTIFFAISLLCLLTGGVRLEADPHTWLYILGVAIPATAVSNMALVQAIKSIGPTLTSIFGAMEPLTAVVIGVWVFAELFTAKGAAGILLIVAAVSVVVLRSRKG